LACWELAKVFLFISFSICAIQKVKTDIHTEIADIHEKSADTHNKNADIHDQNADIHKTEGISNGLDTLKTHP